VFLLENLEIYDLEKGATLFLDQHLSNLATVPYSTSVIARSGFACTKAPILYLRPRARELCKVVEACGEDSYEDRTT